MNKTTSIHPVSARRGFTLIDGVLSLSVIAFMIIIYAGLANIRATDRHVTERAQAADLADEEINALKKLDASTLSNVTNGLFRNVLNNAGGWHIITDANNLDQTSNPCPTALTGDHCGANVLELPGSSSFSNTTSGRLLFPAGAYSAATLQADWYVNSDSPSGWAVGYLYQSTDKDNTYRLRLGATTSDFDSGTAGNQNLVIEKIVNGASTVIFSKSNVTFATNTWNTLKVVLNPAATPTMTVFVNGTQQDANTISDTTFSSGPAALLGWGGVHAEVDDVQTVTTSTSSWTFEGSSILPAAWTRLSLNSLPDGTPTTFDDNGTITVSSYPNVNSTTLKQVIVKIQWTDGGSLQSLTSTVLLGKSGIGL